MMRESRWSVIRIFIERLYDEGKQVAIDISIGSNDTESG